MSYSEGSTPIVDANLNWPQRQSYLFQTVKEYGELDASSGGGRSSIDASTSCGSVSKCGWCGCYHDGVCPRVKAIEYDGFGHIKRVEFHEPHPLIAVNPPVDPPNTWKWFDQKTFLFPDLPCQLR